MATVLKPGQTELATRAITRKARNTEKANSTLQTVVSTMASSPTTKSQAVGSTSGMTAKSTRDSGSKTRCMEMASFHGLMVSIMKGNSGMTKDTATAPSDGKTERSIKAPGLLENSTERESSSV